MDLVQTVTGLLPCATVDLPRDAVGLGREEVPLLAALLAQLACTEREQLFLLQQRGVELVPDGVIALCALLALLEKYRELIEGAGCRCTCLAQTLSFTGVFHFTWHKVARVLRRGFRLADRAFEIDPRRPCDVDVREAVLDVPRYLAKAGARGFGELLLGTQPVQEEREDTVEAGIEIGRGLAPPHLEGPDQLPAAEHGDQQIPVDALVRRQLGVRDAGETGVPRVVRLDALLERRRGGVVEALVVLGESQARRERGGVVVLLLQERVDERCE